MAQAMSASMSFSTAQLSASTSAFRGVAVRAAAPKAAAPKAASLQVVCEEERMRLFNLKPLPGSRRKEQRKGRGHAAGQGLTCGYGNRGQKSRSGGTIRPGFEGGQMPTYRASPKLKGIAGGMASGVPKFITVNLGDLEGFEGEVSLESLNAAGIITVPKSKPLPLKVLGDGEISASLSFKAAAFSASAVSKIEAAGGSVEVLPAKEKWTREAHEAKASA